MYYDNDDKFVLMWKKHFTINIYKFLENIVFYIMHYTKYLFVLIKTWNFEILYHSHTYILIPKFIVSKVVNLYQAYAI